MNLPKRPVLMTIGLPQLGQISSVGSSRSSNRGKFLLGGVEIAGERAVELAQHLDPIFAAHGYLVEIAFHLTP